MSYNKKQGYYVLLAYLAIAYSGIHFFVGYAMAKTVFALLLLALTKMKFITEKAFIYLLIVFSAIIFGQFISLGGFSLTDTLAVLVISIIIPYSIYNIVGHNFPKYYVKAMFIICIISLPFYIGSLLSSSFFHFIQSISEKYAFLDPSRYHTQFILHCAAQAVDPLTGLIRDPGPFHEPGVHALFLTIGYYFNYLTTRKLFNFVGIIFLISILFTFSTAGFLGLLILFFGLYSEFKINPILKILIFIVLFLGSISFFMSSKLMYSKIESEYSVAKEKDLNKYTGGAFMVQEKPFLYFKIIRFLVED